jgi:predicted RNA-binding Zn ribbon-like protein
MRNEMAKSVKVNNSANKDWKDWKQLGGWLCLDFVNTVDRESDGYTEEWLSSYGDLIAWSQHTQIISNQQATQLQASAAQQPELAIIVFETAIALRETIYRIFSALAANNEVVKHDLDALNASLKEALPRLEITCTTNGFIWSWADNGNQLDCILWRIVRSAADLLTSKQLSQVRECASVGCGWIFLDTSRNRSRRWCNMDTCGNRAKAHRHYERRKKTAKHDNAS